MAQEALIPSAAPSRDDAPAPASNAAPTAATPSEPPPLQSQTKGPDVGLGMGRAMVAMQLFEKAKKEYAAVEELTEGSTEYAAALEEVHRRTAAECLKVAQSHGGIYNKAAQFVASLQGGAGDSGIPKAYIDALSVLTDQAPFKPFAEMDACFIEEFGKSAAEVFRSIDQVPLAAASLAQVHRAVTHDGLEVAVKMQYPWLKHHLTSDFAVFAMFGQQIKPGGFDLSWLVRDFQVSLTAELDFEGEAANSERCAAELRHRVDVHVPRVVRQFTSKRVLCTEYVRGMVRCNSLPELRAAGFSPRRVGAALSSVFAEMVFVHGHVHGDPHAGNVYVRRRPQPREKGGEEGGSSGGAGSGGGVANGGGGVAGVGGDHGDSGGLGSSKRSTSKKRIGSGGLDPQIVILDHGLYHDVSDELRSDFCQLVMACIRRDPEQTTRYSQRFAGTSEISRFFPLILSPWFVFGAGQVTAADLKAAHGGVTAPVAVQIMKRRVGIRTFMSPAAAQLALPCCHPLVDYKPN